MNDLLPLIPLPGRTALVICVPLPGRTALEILVPLPGRTALEILVPLPGRTALEILVPLPGRTALFSDSSPALYVVVSISSSKESSSRETDEVSSSSSSSSSSSTVGSDRTSTGIASMIGARSRRSLECVCSTSATLASFSICVTPYHLSQMMDPKGYWTLLTSPTDTGTAKFGMMKDAIMRTVVARMLDSR
jgi:hypothetical protein